MSLSPFPTPRGAEDTSRVFLMYEQGSNSVFEGTSIVFGDAGSMMGGNFSVPGVPIGFLGVTRSIPVEHSHYV